MVTEISMKKSQVMSLDCYCMRILNVITVCFSFMEKEINSLLKSYGKLGINILCSRKLDYNYIECRKEENCVG